MLTARQFAEAIQKPYPTVMGWLQAKKVPGAQLVESPIGSYYEIPADGVNTFSPPTRGRPKKADEAEAIEATRASAPAKAKPAKKRATKKGK